MSKPLCVKKHLHYLVNSVTHKINATCSNNIAKGKYSTQVGHIDLVGKSNVSGILIEGEAGAQPVELEREVNRATDGRATKHGLQDISLRKRSSLYKFLLTKTSMRPC